MIIFLYFNIMEEITITREELYQKVWANPLTQLAKEFKISDVGLRKKCLKRHGKKVKQIPLPKDTDQSPIILYIKDDNGVPCDPTEDERIKIKHEISKGYKIYLEPTTKLTTPHHLVIAAKDHLIGNKTNYEGYIRNDSSEFLDISVSSQSLISQALRVFNSFIWLAEARGHLVKVEKESTVIVIDEIEIAIDIRERQKRIIEKSPGSNYTYHNKIPSGILSFRIDTSPKREWDNSKSPIESNFPAIFAKLETFAAERKQWKIEAEKRRIQQEKERKIKIEQYHTKSAEFKKLERILEDANRLEKAETLRKYADHLETLGKETHEVEWIRAKADWIDPTTGLEDDILGEYCTEPPKYPGYW
ncbi:hypothetical protein [Litoribacter populi]|uniref:hypothetical protein n=1 Tax=Litoribacter populi TaxID=2598460 RepID=UPI00117CB679|nr:hypothetical protein [Litoribacter populi]